MSVLAGKIKKELRSRADPGKAILLQRFFKTGIGECAEGDRFIGVMVPSIRSLAKKYYDIASLSEVEELLHGEVHEERFLALVMLVEKFKKGDEMVQKSIFNSYLNNTKYINNWDLVDVNTPAIVGEYLVDKPRNVLYRLAESKSLWERRISVLATFAFIKRNELDDAMRLAELHLNDRHDLMHKAVGWMLREVGKKDQAVLRNFLDDHAGKMPRTMLRYAIEKLSDTLRKKYLSL